MVVLLLWQGVVLLGAGCKNCLDPPKENPYGEPVTSVRGVGPSGSGHSDAGRTRAASLSWSGLLVWPIGGKRRSYVPFVYGYYTSDAEAVHRAARILDWGVDEEVRTCAPGWRLDLFGPSGQKTLFVNPSCGLVRSGFRFLRVDDAAWDWIRRWIGRARRRPTHKVVRIKVPVAIAPSKIIQAFQSKALVAFQSDPLSGRRPYAKVSVALRSAGVEDLTRLDQEVSLLRQKAKELLVSLARAVVDSRPEAVFWQGPYQLEEDFSRGFRLRWGMTIFFKYGTDELSIRYLLGGLDVAVDEVYVPRFYRLDVLMPAKIRLSEVRRLLAELGSKGKLGAKGKSDSKEKPDAKVKLGLWTHRPKGEGQGRQGRMRGGM